jgi:hypothetical protein
MSPERSTIYQLCQLGPEAVPGTEVAADTLLSSLQISPAVKVETTPYRGTGFKYPSIVNLNKEWVEAEISGPLTYDELPYLLCSVLEDATPTGTTAKAWSWSPSSNSADTVKTFTVEQGGGGRAHLFTYGLVNELTLTFGRDACEISGNMLGQALQDGITMTATPTAVALHPIMPTQVTGKLAATQAGLTGATALARLLRAEWTIRDRFGPIWALNGQVGWSAHVEIEPTIEVKVLMEADAEGMAQLANLRAGSTRWLRLSAEGAVIAGADNYMFQIDQPFKITEVSEFRDEDGVFAIEWTAVGVHDATWGKAVQIDMKNTLAAL